MNREERRAAARAQGRGGRLLGQVPTALGAEVVNPTGRNRCFVCHRLHLRNPREPVWIITNQVAQRQGCLCQRHKDEMAEMDQMGGGTSTYNRIRPGELVTEFGIEVPA